VRSAPTSDEEKPIYDDYHYYDNGKEHAVYDVDMHDKKVSKRTWQQKFDPPYPIPIKEAKFIRQNSPSPIKKKSSSKSKSGATLRLPISSPKSVRRENEYDKFLKSSDEEDDFNRETNKEQGKMDDEDFDGNFMKPYFAYSVNTAKLTKRIPKEPTDKALVITHLKSNSALHPVINNVDAPNVESQYSFKNLHSYLTGNEELWRKYDGDLKRKAEYLKFEHTNKRFL
jgi:hypothetical protein